MSAAHNLIWDDYSKDIESGFCEIFRSGILHDVTLIAEGQKLPAHKLILALSSSRFKQMFSDNSSQNQQTILFISEISFRALKVLVEFMYTGEVSVQEDLLEEVLRGAKIFQIKALMDKSSTENSETNPDKQLSPSSEGKRQKRVSRVPYRYQYDTKTKKKKPTESTETKSVVYMEMNGESELNNTQNIDSQFYETDPIALGNESELLDVDTTDKFDDMGLEPEVDVSEIQSQDESVDTKDNIVLLTGAPSSLKYIRNKNGNFCLVLNDHIYMKQTVHRNKVFWRCQMHNRLGCKSRCVTEGNTIVKKVAIHSHAPQTDKVIECEINGEIVYM